VALDGELLDLVPDVLVEDVVQGPAYGVAAVHRQRFARRPGLVDEHVVCLVVEPGEDRVDVAVFDGAAEFFLESHGCLPSGSCWFPLWSACVREGPGVTQAGVISS